MSLDESANDARPSALAALPPLSGDGLPRYPGPAEEGPRVAEGGVSGYSTAAIILGIVPVLFGILGIVFGFIALGQIKQRGQKGRGNALTGVIAGSAWLIIGIVALTVAVLSGGKSAGTVDIDAVRVGQCFTTTQNATALTQVSTVDCAQAHTDQLFARYEAVYTTYPGLTALTNDAQSQCSKLARGSVQTSAVTDTMTLTTVVPDPVKWDRSHLVECLIEEGNDVRWTGSVMASATGP